MTSGTSFATTRQASELFRWWQIILGATCMLVPGTLLYGWTAFVNPINVAHRWSITDIQWAFTCFALSEACFMWAMGWFVDRFGIRWALFASGGLVVFGASINSTAESLSMLYIGQAISGLGSGIVTCATIRSAVAWFPGRRRGLATGLVVMGFALGALVTILPMVDFINTIGYSATFLWFGGLMGIGLMLVSQMMRLPRDAEVPADPRVTMIRRTFAPYRSSQMVRTRAFWVLGAVLLFIVMSGNLVTAQLGPIMTYYGTKDIDVILVGVVSVSGFKLAIFIDRCCNAAGRPFFGFISDYTGRERALALALVLEAIGVYLLLTVAHDPFWFSVLSGAVFFAFGEIYVLVPALIADIYGEKHAATNYGWIYIAKGLASLWVPLGSMLVQWSGSWDLVFYIAIFADVVAALLALSLIRLRTAVDTDIEWCRRLTAAPMRDAV